MSDQSKTIAFKNWQESSDPLRPLKIFLRRAWCAIRGYHKADLNQLYCGSCNSYMFEKRFEKR